MTQEEWQDWAESEWFPRYETVELRGTHRNDILLSKLENLPTKKSSKICRPKDHFISMIGIGKIRSLLLDLRLSLVLIYFLICTLYLLGNIALIFYQQAHNGQKPKCPDLDHTQSL